MSTPRTLGSEPHLISAQPPKHAVLVEPRLASAVPLLKESTAGMDLLKGAQQQGSLYGVVPRRPVHEFAACSCGQAAGALPKPPPACV